MKFGPGNPATRIVAAAVVMLAVTAIVVGSAVMVIMQDRLESEISGGLTATLANRVRLFISLVQLRESQMLFVSMQPGLKRSARAIAAGRNAYRIAA